MKKKTKFYALFTGIYLCCAISCGYLDPAPPLCSTLREGMVQNQTMIPNSTRCIVICDFSSSMDTASVGFVKRTALDIFDKFYNRASIEYYPVANSSMLPMFEVPAFSAKDTLVDPINIQDFNTCVDSNKPALRNQLLQALGEASKSRQQATFLISSIEHAVNEILVADRLQQKKNVIILLSDMKECAKSAMGDINLDNNNVKEAQAKIDLVAKRTDLPELKTNIEFRVGYYSKNPPDNQAMQRFWNTVLHKLNYTDSIVLSSNVNTKP